MNELERRVRTCRLLEKMERNPEYSKALKLKDISIFKTNYKEEKPMRKTRSDCTVGAFERNHGLPPGTIRNRDGRDTRSDKLIGTIRKEAEKRK